MLVLSDGPQPILQLELDVIEKDLGLGSSFFCMVPLPSVCSALRVCDAVAPLVVDPLEDARDRLPRHGLIAQRAYDGRAVYWW